MNSELYLNSVQCAAVSTHFSFIKVPPQNVLTKVVDEEKDSPTCHPISPIPASTPPTTLVENPFLLNALRPQKHLKDTNIVY